MGKTRSWVMRCSIAVSTLFLLGEDVERQPIEIFPPELEDNHRELPDPSTRDKPPDPHALEWFGPEVGITRPTRLILELPISLTPPVQPNEKTLSEAEMINKRIDDYLMTQAAIQRVQTGSIDPGWRNFSSRMEHYFRPDFEHTNDPTTEISWAWMRKTLWDWMGNWYRSADSQNQTRTYGSEFDRKYLADSSSFELQKAAVRNSEYGNTFTTLVEIRFQKDKPLSVTLIGSSGQKKFDQEALQAAQKAAQTITQQELPEEHGRALYAVSANYAILPPLPVVGFGFDLMMGYFDLFYPLKKMVSGRADLFAVFR